MPEWAKLFYITGFYMQFFHFTSRTKFESMQDGAYYQRSGLLPIRRLFSYGSQGVYGLPEKVADGVSYGFVKAFDPGWYHKQIYQGSPALETVMDNICAGSRSEVYLIAATLSEDDDAFVVDKSHYLRGDYRDKERSTLSIVKEVNQAYWNSCIPVMEYESGNVRFSMPEIICFSPITSDRLQRVGVYNKPDLINKIRGLAGLPAHVPQPAPDYSALCQYMVNDPDVPHPPEPPKGGGLRLVHNADMN